MLYRDLTHAPVKVLLHTPHCEILVKYYMLHCVYFSLFLCIGTTKYVHGSLSSILSLMITLIVAEFQIDASEIVLFIWIFSLLKEEIAQMINDKPCIFSLFLRFYFIVLIAY